VSSLFKRHTLALPANVVVSAVAVAVAAAQADTASTTGGIVVRSEDNKFDARLGGRIHFDFNDLYPDKGSRFDSGAADNNGGFFFRRLYLTLGGTLYDWHYYIEEDLANTSVSGLQDAWFGHKLFGNDALLFGQHKPWRSFDEITSNNEILFLERNVLSANGIFGGRDYQDGVFYKYQQKGLIGGEDNFFGGWSAYSLNKNGQNSTQGIGYNGRLAYAPLLRERAWLHLGASYSSDHADNGNKLSAGYSTYYAKQGVAQNLVSLAGNAGGNNPRVATVTAELAGALGPLYLNGEYAQACFSQPGQADQTVDAFSAVGSIYLTGETKPYRAEEAVIRSARPLHPYGALELAARYDYARNRSLPAGNTKLCAPTAPAGFTPPADTAIDSCKLSSLALGVNYTVNPAVRFMLDYTLGEVDLGGAGKDRPKALSGRMQLVF
jgi:phosphate-selective porin OprO/OprP